MKIERFLNWILEKLVNYPDIDFKTVKMFVDKFECYLSKTEKARYRITLQLIREFTSKQISLDSFVSQQITENLETQLNNIKNEVKKK